MRGIAKGQSIHVIIVRQIAELISEAVGKGSSILCDAVAWLVTNSMRVEQLCQLQLWQQCMCNIWRKMAFRELLESEQPAQDDDTVELPALTTRFHKTLSEEEITKVWQHVFSTLCCISRYYCVLNI